MKAEQIAYLWFSLPVETRRELTRQTARKRKIDKRVETGKCADCGKSRGENPRYCDNCASRRRDYSRKRMKRIRESEDRND